MGGIAHEAKAGINVALTRRTESQILKDVELIARGQIRGAHWHFFQGVKKEGSARLFEVARDPIYGLSSAADFEGIATVKFSFFESLSRVEAREFLDRFLREESKAASAMLEEARAEGIRADFSIESLESFFSWVLERVSTIRRLPNPEIPSWAQRTPSYLAGLFDFDDPSKLLVLRAAYYLGESFVRSFPARLRWDTGNPDFAETHQPVVAGFRGGLEMSPILITENLFRRVLADGAGRDSVAKAVSVWTNDVPT